MSFKKWQDNIKVYQIQISPKTVLEKVKKTTRSYLLEEIKHKDLMSEKHREVCSSLNYFEHFFISVSTVIGCVSNSALASVISVSVGIARPALTLKVYALTAGIKKYKSIIKKKSTIILR